MKPQYQAVRFRLFLITGVLASWLVLSSALAYADLFFWEWNSSPLSPQSLNFAVQLDQSLSPISLGSNTFDYLPTVVSGSSILTLTNPSLDLRQPPTELTGLGGDFQNPEFAFIESQDPMVNISLSSNEAIIRQESLPSQTIVGSWGTETVTESPAPIPEPASWLLLGFGLTGVALYKNRKLNFLCACKY